MSPPYAEVAADEPMLLAENYMAGAKCATLSDDFRTALRLYQKAFMSSDSDTQRGVIMLNTGICHARLGEWENSRRRCVRALTFDDTVAKCHYHLARALMHLGFYTEAQQSIQKAQAQYGGTDRPFATLQAEIADATRRNAPPRDNRSGFLVALLASHIDSEARLDKLRRCLRSVEDQTKHVLLLVSHSAETPELARRTEQLIAYYCEERPVIHHYISTGSHRLSQFEHLRLLLDYMLQHQDFYHDIWLRFIDDDDVLHPENTAYFWAGICHAVLTKAEEPEHDFTVRFPQHAARVDDESVAIGDAGDVDRALRQTAVVVTPQSEQFGPEIWQYAVPMGIVSRFFAYAVATLLEDRYCDVAFVSFLRTFDTFATESDTHSWLYFYDHVDNNPTKRRVINGPTDYLRMVMTLWSTAMYGPLRRCETEQQLQTLLDKIDGIDDDAYKFPEPVAPLLRKHSHGTRILETILMRIGVQMWQLAAVQRFF